MQLQLLVYYNALFIKKITKVKALIKDKFIKLQDHYCDFIGQIKVSLFIFTLITVII